MSGWQPIKDEHGRFAGLRSELRITPNRSSDGRIDSISAGARTFVVLRERGRIVGFREET